MPGQLNTLEERLAKAKHHRAELREELYAASDSVRWLKAELRVLSGTKASEGQRVYLLGGLALLAWSVALWMR